MTGYHSRGRNGVRHRGANHGDGTNADVAWSSRRSIAS